MMDSSYDQLDNFYCDPEEEPWVTEEGWFELLRQYTDASKLSEDGANTWSLLWIYVPDYMLKGKMGEIKMIPQRNSPYLENDPNPYWQQTEDCAGFTVSDDCPWRYEEMSLVTFTPDVCTNSELIGCEYLVAYARILQISNTQEEASL